MANVGRTMITVVALCVGLGCGSDNNGGEENNGSANGETNGTPNGETNGTPNGETNESTATVDWTVSVGDYSGMITDCSWETGTANQIRRHQQQDGSWLATLNCSAAEDGNPTGAFTVSLGGLDSAVGTTDAADFELTCGANGCSGTVMVEISYQDGAAGVLMSGRSTLADELTGSMTIDTFDGDTGEFAGSVDVTLTVGEDEYSVSGPFNAITGECTEAACTGRML
jgi:hypothetical protein